jgi:hypothetical protein
MTRSEEVSFEPGFACVGSAWVDPTYRLVKDSTNLDKRTFLRADMINEYGIKSIGFTKFRNGVLEYGTRTGWVDAPNLDMNGRGKRSYEFLLEKPPESSLRSTTATEDFLLEMLLDVKGGEYALFWEYNADDGHYLNTGYFSVDDTMMASAKGITATVASLLDRARTSGLPRFIKKIKEIAATDCALVPVRVSNDVQSIILIPYVEGILEIGTRSTWDEPPTLSSVAEFVRSDKVVARPHFEPTMANLRTIIDNVSADYAMWWEWLPGEGKLKMTAYNSLDGKIMAASVEYEFTPGFACVGSAWVDPTFRLVRDSTNLDIRTFLRADMINECGVKSIGFTKFPNGVLEYGTTDGWDEAPNIDTDSRGRRRPAFLINTERPAFKPTTENLRKVMRFTSAAYSIFWEYVADINELRCAAYHSRDGQIMEPSRTFTFVPGWACVGTAWVDPSYTLVPDSTNLDIKTFLRSNLLKVDGIKSIGFTKFANGVVEYGSTTFWDGPPSIDTNEHGRRVQDFLV